MWYPIETCNEYTGIMIWAGRIPRRNKIRLQYHRIQRMHSPTTNGATDMHWMSYQTEKNTNVYIECVPTRKRCPCENWESTRMSYHTSATTAATFSLGTMENRGGGWWNRWSIPFSYCTIYPSSSSSSSSYHQFMSEYHTE
jgi:hypothetical protein